MGGADIPPHFRPSTAAAPTHPGRAEVAFPQPEIEMRLQPRQGDLYAAFARDQDPGHVGITGDRVERPLPVLPCPQSLARTAGLGPPARAQPAQTPLGLRLGILCPSDPDSLPLGGGADAR